MTKMENSLTSLVCQFILTNPWGSSCDFILCIYIKKIMFTASLSDEIISLFLFEI